MVAFKDKPILTFSSLSAWETYLSSSPNTTGIRLKIRKKSSTSLEGLTRTEAVEGALCHGWIDSQAGKLDDDHSLLAFTPRRKTSVWSQVNRDIVEKLIATGRMKPAGLIEVDQAKEDGRWARAYKVKGAEAPVDLQEAIDANEEAKAYWATLTGSARHLFIFRLEQAKKQETRERRIREYVQLLAKGERLK